MSAMTAAAQAPRLLCASTAPTAWPAARACSACFRCRWYPAHRAQAHHLQQLRHRLAFAPMLASETGIRVLASGIFKPSTQSEMGILKPSTQTVCVAKATPTAALVSLTRNHRLPRSRRHSSAPVSLQKSPTLPQMATAPVLDPILQTVIWIPAPTVVFVWCTRPHHMLRRFRRASPSPQACA